MVLSLIFDRSETQNCRFSQFRRLPFCDSSDRDKSDKGLQASRPHQDIVYGEREIGLAKSLAHHQCGAYPSQYFVSQSNCIGCPTSGLAQRAMREARQL
jgi:hypothetical protein